MVNHNDSRIILVKLFFLLLPIVLVFKLFNIQVLSHTTYKVLAKNQQIKQSVLEAPRGNIFFSDGSPLAINTRTYFFIIEPVRLNQKADLGLAREILKIVRPSLYDLKTEDSKNEDSKKYDIAVKEEEFLSLLKQDNWYLPIERGVTPEQKEKLEALNVEGFSFLQENSRFYPEGDLAMSLLGFVARDINGDPFGYNGIEGYYNGDLTGKAGSSVLESDGFGKPLIFGSQNFIDPMVGRDITLTIERNVQYSLESKIRTYTKKYGAKSGVAVAINPKTGEVLGMASFYNPERKEDEEEIDNFFNYAIGRVYEPGSIIKPFTLSAALDLKLINPLTEFMDGGPVYYSGYKIENWANKHYGLQNMYDLLIHSNNIGAAWVSEKIGSQKLSFFLKNFGFGTKTEVDLEGEDTGTIRDYEEWRDIDLATASFGQGFSATPLQVAMGYSAIANGGILLRPYVVKSINLEKKVYLAEKKEISRPIKEETSQIMTEMLQKAADVFRDQYSFSKSYKISGKTGTAEIYTEDGYDTDKTNATYVGYPTTSRKFVLLVKFEEPQYSVLANETAVPCWMDIAGDLSVFYKLEPDYNQ